MGVDIDHFFRGNKEIFEFIGAELIFGWTGDLIELKFDFIVGENFISDKAIVSRFHEISCVHSLIGESGID